VDEARERERKRVRLHNSLKIKIKITTYKGVKVWQGLLVSASRYCNYTLCRLEVHFSLLTAI